MIWEKLTSFAGGFFLCFVACFGVWAAAGKDNPYDNPYEGTVAGESGGVSASAPPTGPAKGVGTKVPGSRAVAPAKGERTEAAEEVAPAPRKGSEVAARGGPSVEAIISGLKSLKERIEASEKRLDEIVGLVLSSVETKGGRLVLVYRSEMSPDFKLIQAVFSLDGAPIFKKSDDEGFMKDQEIVIYDGAILPGKHTLSVTLVYRGHGYGILSYLSKYRFKVKSGYSFKVEPGRGVQVKVVSFEKGDVETKLEERPAIKYIERKITME